MEEEGISTNEGLSNPYCTIRPCLVYSSLRSVLQLLDLKLYIMELHLVTKRQADAIVRLALKTATITRTKSIFRESLEIELDEDIEMLVHICCKEYNINIKELALKELDVNR